MFRLVLVHFENMDAIEKKTFWSLPAQPLPAQTEIVGPVFVTIWLIIVVAFTYFFAKLLLRPKPTWIEFRDITIGTGLLGL